MPEVAYRIGRWVRLAQRYARAVRDEFSEEFAYVDEHVRVVRGELQSVSGTVRGELQSIGGAVREETARLDSELHDFRLVPEPASPAEADAADSTPDALPESHLDPERFIF
jgi:hypothetical protein